MIMVEIKDKQVSQRERAITRVTLEGSVINIVLLTFKFIAGILGHSGAMIADAVHSLSDFITDIIVIIFVHVSSKPIDSDHDYGHGKYETLATALVSIMLLVVGAYLMFSSVVKIWSVMRGVILPRPGIIALVAALASIALKEWAYQFTVRLGKKVHSDAVIANAWHHRSDALSSVGTAIGIGGAILLGSRWTVLDPLAALVVSVFIVISAFKLVNGAVGELTEKSLPADVEQHITDIVCSEPQVSAVHNLRTRHIGNATSIEMHVRMPGNLTLYEAHQHATNIEHALRHHFGNNTLISIHMEPVKVNGKYEEPGR